jgi:ribosomal protein L11 methylase PrmA
MTGGVGDVATVPGSFRDPAGHVVRREGRIYRTINRVAVEDFDYVRKTAFYQSAVSDGRLIAARLLDHHEAQSIARDAVYVVEHPSLPFVSYPYEWCFPELKAAALHHLDLQLSALESGVTFSDASAYNVQFVGTQPLFIDTLSLRPYRPGELWAGHRQFCEQFLNPLLLRALLGVPHNAWYRGTQGGILTKDLRKLLRLRHKLSRRVGTHVVLQDILQDSVGKKPGLAVSSLAQAGLPVSGFRKLLRDLRNWVGALKPLDTGVTVWRDYAREHSYSSEEVAAKKAFISEFVSRNRLRGVWDIGCNTGEYAVSALHGGAEHVVGFDFDQGALEVAFARSVEERLEFLPLFLDAANPSPSQGWEQRERDGLQQRATCDGLVALALVHHLAITHNIPLEWVVRWLVELAPRGVIEFVPKTDPMVQELLKLRQDIFPDYHEQAFLAHLRCIASVGRSIPSSASGRLLVEFTRSSSVS